MENDKLCLPCHSQCHSCRNASDISCISCKSGLFLIHDAMTCVKTCPEQYYTGRSFIEKYILKRFSYQITDFKNVFVVKLAVHHVILVRMFVHHVSMGMLSKTQIVLKHHKFVSRANILILTKIGK